MNPRIRKEDPPNQEGKGLTPETTRNKKEEDVEILYSHLARKETMHQELQKKKRIANLLLYLQKIEGVATSQRKH
jgi:hypothetical protein